MKTKHNDPKPMRWEKKKKNSKREVYSNASLPQGTRIISKEKKHKTKQTKKKPILTSKGIGKKEQTKLKVSKRKEIVKIIVEINEIEPEKYKRKDQQN